jgi:hypothetical protein
MAKILRFRNAASIWMSYVLITGFAVILSVFMYSFMVDYTKSSADDMKKVVYNTDECRSVSINIESVCLSAQSLNITLQNSNYARIDRLDFRIYDGRIPKFTNQTNITMNPNRVKTVSLNIGTASASRVEVIPHIEKDNMDMVCADRKAEKEFGAC